MNGFVRVAAVTPTIKVADCEYNAGQIVGLIQRAGREGVRLVVMPELCVTGYTCGDLFLQKPLINAARSALERIVSETADCDIAAVVGLPLDFCGKLYNVAAVFCRGKILGFVPKTHLPNYGEFYELRQFTPAIPAFDDLVESCGIPFGTRLVFEVAAGFTFAVEICEDLWAVSPPSNDHAARAEIIVNLSASDETIGKADYRRSLAAGQSAKCLCAYVYANAGRGESTNDMVFGGHNIITENGKILAESPPFGEGWAVSEIDLQALSHDRRRINSFGNSASGYRVVKFSLCEPFSPTLSRKIDPAPFTPSHESKRAARCEEILNIQAHGLAKQLEHIRAQAVIGVSGGLDSTLALLVVARAYDLLGMEKSGIIAVTMPCFGTTSRTKNNAQKLCEALGIPCREIDISETVRSHLRDISHPENLTDITFENAQARVRTLVLMDLANQQNGIVVGTGNLSELALGWATYNGDHMSMYGVNAGVPKTLVRHIVKHVSETCENAALSAVLEYVFATPVSPELLPPKGDEISQNTEEIVGPYELHDFFLFHTLRHGREVAQTYELACLAFDGKYNSDTIKKWLKIFVSRFFSQQFKRNCMPNGPKIGSVSLSPRGDWRMPSDASGRAWARP